MNINHLFFAAGFMVAGVQAGWGAEARPNIVFLYADDMRWDSFGAIQREQGEAARFPWLQTPRMDGLLGQSVRFRQSFVVTSLCSPGRAAVMTSQYGHLNGIIDNGTPLPETARTFAEHLRKAGYATAYFGKWHMDGQRERPHYDTVASFVGQGKYFDCPLLVNGVETPTQGWVDEVTTDYAVRYIEGRKDQAGQPFFLWLGFKSPHGPRGGDNLPESLRNLYAGEESRGTANTGLTAIYQPERAAGAAGGAGAGGAAGARPRQRRSGEGAQTGHQDFHRHISGMDACVGRVLDALRGAGLDGNTIVMLTSDNGYYLGEHGLGDKRSAYDESLRVPLLVRLPGGKMGGAVNDAMVLNLDYGPTILDFAGASPLPEAQGRSLRPLLEGRPAADWRTAYFYEYFQEKNFPQPTILAVRTETHKLITYPGRPEWTEVFDLARDPYETRNLAGEKKLRAALEAQLEAESRAARFRWPEGMEKAGGS